MKIQFQPEVVSTLKRVTSTIFNTGGFIRKIDNLGLKPIPYKTRAHGHVYKEAKYDMLGIFLPITSLSPKI